MANWTVLIYMSANNDLTDHLARNLKSLIDALKNPVAALIERKVITNTKTALKLKAIEEDKAGTLQLTQSGRERYGVGDPKADVTVAVMFDGGRKHPLNGLHILRNGDAEFGGFNWDGADATSFADVLTTTVQLFPANRFALIMSGHGTGVSGIEGIPQRLCYRCNGEGGLLTSDLANAVKKMQDAIGHPLSVLALDACLMQMLEVPLSFHGAVEYFLASQQTIKGAGAFDLASFYWRLTGQPGMAALELATLLYGNFGTQQGNAGRTYSLINMSALKSAAIAVNNFADAACKEKKPKELAIARESTTSYAEQNKSAERRDLAEFIKKSGVKSPETYTGPIQGAVLKSSGSGCGLSIYTGPPTPEYCTLNSAGLDKWINLLKYMYPI